jgi:hypothetical protein
MMVRLRTFLLLASAVVCAGFWPAYAADVTDAQKSAICQTRKTCAIAPSLHNAGSSAAGPLSVAELHFGLADKPDDAPDEGCIAGDYETRDGGVEYWLLEGSELPRLLLRLCNDGYGAAGVGEDEVTVAENRFVHHQYGGSASRWEETTTETLSPLRLVNVRSCSFHTLIPGSGELSDIDPAARIARSVAVATDPAKAEEESDENGAEVDCPDWPETAAFTPTPTTGLIAGYDLPIHIVAGDSIDLPADDWSLGDCGFTMATDGRNGFIVFGQPAAATDVAEITALALAENELVLQVYDPTAAAATAAAAGKSWVHRPHVELWLAPDWDRETNPPADENLRQVGINLDGNVYAAKGGKDTLPKVARWQAKDAAGQSVTVLRLSWAENSYPFLAGLGLVYSQAGGGKQLRLVANTGIVKNRPLYLPRLVDPGRSLGDRTTACQLRDGVLMANRSP